MRTAGISDPYSKGVTLSTTRDLSSMSYKAHTWDDSFLFCFVSNFICSHISPGWLGRIHDETMAGVCYFVTGKGNKKEGWLKDWTALITELGICKIYKTLDRLASVGLCLSIA